MVLSAANFATQAHCLVLFLRLLGLLPQQSAGSPARAGSGGHSAWCEPTQSPDRCPCSLVSSSSTVVSAAATSCAVMEYTETLADARVCRVPGAMWARATPGGGACAVRTRTGRCGWRTSRSASTPGRRPWRSTHATSAGRRRACCPRLRLLHTMAFAVSKLCSSIPGNHKLSDQEPST